MTLTQTVRGRRPRPPQRTPHSLTLVTPTFFPEQLGTPLYVADTARWFAKKGWRTIVVTGQPYYPEYVRHPDYGAARRYDSMEGIPIFRVPTIVPRRGSAVGRIASDINFVAQAALSKAYATIPHTNAVLTVSPGTPLSAIAGHLLAARSGAKHAILVHDVLTGLATGLGMVRTQTAKSAIASLERRALNLGERVLTLSPEMSGVLRKLGVTRPIEVLPLWPTVDKPTETSIRTDVQFSGNFGRKQGIRSLVEVLKALSGLRPHTSMVIRGSGPLEGYLKDQVARFLPNVHLEKPVPEEQLPMALASSRIHLVPQIPAAAPHVVPSKVVNALAVGGVVVAMSAPGSPLHRIAAECEGLVVTDPVDVRAAAKTIAQLLDDPALARMSRCSIDYIKQCHNRDRILSTLADTLLGAPIGTWSDG